MSENSKPGSSRRRAGIGIAVALVIGAGVAVAAGPMSLFSSAAPAASSAPIDGAAVENLEKSADKAVAAGLPGVIVRVDGGQSPAVNVVRQASWASADHRLDAGDDFKMGSNTKTITAALVLQLVAENRVGLDDSVEKFLPGAVPNGRLITLRMLLNHTSGLEDYAYTLDGLDLMTGRQTQQPSPTEVLAFGTKLPPFAAPGASWHYSNTGYSALGLVLEKVTGQKYADLVEERIVRPLGLQHTYVAGSRSESVVHAPLAHGYEPDATELAAILPPGLPKGFGFVGAARGERVDVTAVDHSWVGPEGAVVSTVADWAKFDRALMSGNLVPEPLLRAMRTVVPEDEAAGPDHKYGLGLEQYNSPCGVVWGHQGSWPGYSSDTYTDQTGQRTVAVLSTTRFGLKASAAAGTAYSELVNTAVCTMLGKSLPK
ncbi:serine hydrolase [Amycolatopsis sp. NBRC 101858]|uniref:serine hydrolase domain-containing protein n=1 Tax=Amycolatopsis sp. NBRC 101858 TaxID=3032200 RepID=UPI0024A1643D|nr:serine hydrolase domain-containing protein [Amycolatopsis sp. NBRC 101858]GLY42906.1 serine hydrolase [Amycolatopsis sp. NBRC 101858]